MTTTPPHVWTRAQELTRLDLRPLTPLPSGRRIALAGLLAIVGSLVADAVLSTISAATLSPPAYFDKFNAGSYAPLTIIGVVGATVGWALLVRLTSQPQWFVIRAAVVVTIVGLIPDVALLSNNPTGAVIGLMVEHLVIAVITTYALLKVAPAGSPRAAQTEPTSPTMAEAGDPARR